jgi:hypothetical protein
VRIGAEPPLPHRIAEQGYPRAARQCFLLSERAAQQGFHTKQREQIGRHESDGGVLRSFVAVDEHVSTLKCGQILERSVLFFPIDEVGKGRWRIG